MDKGLTSYLEFLANYLLYKHNCVTLPTDLPRLARRLGVEQVSYEDMVAEGCVEKSGDALTIKIRKDAPVVRQRFSLAHELGHVIINKLVKASTTEHYREFRRFGRVADDVGDEALADQIAGLLLLPSAFIVGRLAGRLRLGAVIGMSVEARISLSTALIRTVDVATLPCVAFMLRASEGTKPCLKWSRFSPSSDRRVFKDLENPNVIESLVKCGTPRPEDVGGRWKECEIHRRSFTDISTIFGLAHLSS